jgi:effector-binding domain-containing protein
MPSTPEFKTINPTTFLFYRTETTVDQLIHQIQIGQQLFKEAVEKGLFICGPVHWHYFNFEGDHKPFTLEIALPVREAIADYDGQFHFKRTEPFQCVCLTHEGGWTDIPKSYEKLMAFVSSKGKTPLTTAREVYVQVDFHNQEANVTEIQLGFQ